MTANELTAFLPATRPDFANPRAWRHVARAILWATRRHYGAGAPAALVAWLASPTFTLSAVVHADGILGAWRAWADSPSARRALALERIALAVGMGPGREALCAEVRGQIGRVSHDDH